MLILYLYIIVFFMRFDLLKTEWEGLLSWFYILSYGSALNTNNNFT